MQALLSYQVAMARALEDEVRFRRSFIVGYRLTITDKLLITVGGAFGDFTTGPDGGYRYWQPNSGDLVLLGQYTDMVTGVPHSYYSVHRPGCRDLYLDLTNTGKGAQQILRLTSWDEIPIAVQEEFRRPLAVDDVVCF